MLQQALLDAPKFGNDKEEADEIAVRLHEFICQTIRSQKTGHGWILFWRC